MQQFLSGAGSVDKLVEYLQAEVLKELRAIYGEVIPADETRR